MNIASMSGAMNQMNLKQQVDVALMKKAMNVVEGNANAMTEMLKETSVQAPHPTSGGQIDIKA